MHLKKVCNTRQSISLSVSLFVFFYRTCVTGRGRVKKDCIHFQKSIKIWNWEISSCLNNANEWWQIHISKEMGQGHVYLFVASALLFNNTNKITKRWTNSIAGINIPGYQLKLSPYVRQMMSLCVYTCEGVTERTLNFKNLYVLILRWSDTNKWMYRNV